MKRLLILSRYCSDGASSRMRFYQYSPGLKKAGWEVTITPLLCAEYLERLYAGRKPKRRDIALDYIKRIFAVLNARQYDLIWIEKEIFPFLPEALEMVIRFPGVPYIVDYDDAIFHSYDQHKHSLVRRILGSKLDRLLQKSTAVTAGNPYLAAYCSQHGAPDVHVIPTVIDIERYHATPLPCEKTMRIGWIGSPATTPLLEKILPQLASAAQNIPIILVTIGASSLQQKGLIIEQHSWSENDENRLLQTIDIGIMPLSDTPFERGKCGYKIIQYAGAGRPVIASAIGANTNIVTKETGFLVKKDTDWKATIIEASSSLERLTKMGVAARKRAESKYSLQIMLPQLLKIFDAAIITGKTWR